jgi:HAD superfamily hydrolase (TIGR01509 family)
VIKAIIFDCFGVIRVDATIIAYKKLGGDSEVDEQFISETVAKANAGLIPNAAAAIAQHLGISEEKWRETVYGSSVIDQEVLDYIKQLRQQYKTALLSNVAKHGLKFWFEPGQLEEYFDVAIGSGDIGFAKPEPEAYEITADKLGVRLEECVMVDDRLELCEGAQAVGMKPIRYKGLKQLKSELEPMLAAVSNN